MLTDQQHPLTPPPELVEQLRKEAPHGIRDAGVTRELHLITAAYRAGADAELEACCDWLYNTCCDNWDETQIAAELRAARRPKPPSLAEQALKALQDQIDTSFKLSSKAQERVDLICAALERLQELENNG